MPSTLQGGNPGVKAGAQRHGEAAWPWRSRENPNLLQQDNFIQEAFDLVGKMQSPEAFQILDGMRPDPPDR